jgi:hypothetical protein
MHHKILTGIIRVRYLINRKKIYIKTLCLINILISIYIAIKQLYNILSTRLLCLWLHVFDLSASFVFCRDRNSLSPYRPWYFHITVWSLYFNYYLTFDVYKKQRNLRVGIVLAYISIHFIILFIVWYWYLALFLAYLLWFCWSVSGWAGESCEVFVCIDIHNCYANGECTGPNTCSCYDGWNGGHCIIASCR